MYRTTDFEWSNVESLCTVTMGSAAKTCTCCIIGSRFVLQPPDFNPYRLHTTHQSTLYLLFPHLRPLPYTCSAKHLLLSSLQQLSALPFILVYTLTLYLYFTIYTLLTPGAHPQCKQTGPFSPLGYNYKQFLIVMM